MWNANNQKTSKRDKYAKIMDYKSFYSWKGGSIYITSDRLWLAFSISTLDIYIRITLHLKLDKKNYTE